MANEVWGRSVIQLPVPILVLEVVAKMNLSSARMFNYAPMLTPGKIREIIHPDWSCDITEVSRDLNWQPGIRLVDAMQDMTLLGI